jgi:chemotaxis-related protein WspD
VTSLTILPPQSDCWNRIGVRGDRTCPELKVVVHCHNCPVFANAGRQFLNAPSPDGYLDEWTERLAAPPADAASDLQSVLVFRLGAEWLALPVQVLVELTLPRPVHRVPHRGGLLAGLVNVRGELYLCVHLDQLLGIPTAASDGPAQVNGSSRAASARRLLVVQRQADRWVFPVDEADQVYRFPNHELTTVPATVARSAVRLTRGVFACAGKAVGYLDDARLFQTLRSRVR